ncbi:MAG: EMC3/TMCO1 family protein [archaeon]
MNPVLIPFSLIVVLISFCFFAISKIIVDQRKLMEIKEKMKKYQEELKEARKKGDMKKIEELNNDEEFLKLSKEMISLSFKPMLVTMIPAIVIFLLVGNALGSFGTLAVLPLINLELNWIGVYLLVSIISSILFESIYRKIWKV